MKTKQINAKPKETAKPAVNQVTVKPVQKDLAAAITQVTNGFTGVTTLLENITTQERRVNTLASLVGVQEIHLSDIAKAVETISTDALGLKTATDDITKQIAGVPTTVETAVISTLNTAISGKVTNSNGNGESTLTGSALIEHLVSVSEVLRPLFGSLLIQMKELTGTTNSLSSAVQAMETEQTGITNRLGALETTVKEMKTTFDDVFTLVTEKLEGIIDRIATLENKEGQ